VKKTPQQKAMKWQREADEIIAGLRAKAADDPEIRRQLLRAIKVQRREIAGHLEGCDRPNCRMVEGMRIGLAGLLLCCAAVVNPE
jgi:hypothetical protein